MKLLSMSIALLLCICAISLGLEEDDPAIVGVWLFEGDVKDATDNGNDGKINGNFKFEDGKFGKAVVAGGRRRSIDVPDSKSIGSVKKELTVAAWFRVDADSDTGVRKNGAYLLEDQSGGEPIPDGFSFRVWTGAGHHTWILREKQKLEQGKWYHVAGTYDGTNVEMYIDGEP